MILCINTIPTQAAAVFIEFTFTAKAYFQPSTV